MNWTAVLLTVKLAALTTLVLAVAGLPIAYWLATTRRAWRPFVDAAIAIPLILPPTVLGFYFLLATGPTSAFGRFYGWLSGGSLPFTFEGILAASVLYNLPFAVRPFTAGFAAVDRRLIEAARCLGASPFRAFIQVVLPLAWPSVLAGIVLSFAHTVGEFGVVLMVGGNIPGVTRTVALAIYDDVQALDYGAANEASAALLLFAIAALSVTYALQRRSLPMSRIDVDIAFQYPRGHGVECTWQESLEPGSVTAWLGASGSGKTTLLRCLAGLETPQRGHVEFDGRRWFDAVRKINVRPEARNVGVLFQEYALFPHLTVEQNVRFGAPADGRMPERTADLLALFRLDGLERRLPRELSGGQQQRVALARAIYRHPSLLLLDEPLSALDASMREELRHDLATLIRDSEIPACIITHDRFDALTLADRIVLVDAGRIVQTGPTRAVFAEPANEAAARLVGVDTVLVGAVEKIVYGLAHVRVAGQQVCAEAPPGTGRELALCIRAEDVTIALQPPHELSAINQWRATVGSDRPEGPFVRVILDCGFRLAALITRETWQRLGLKRGDQALAIVKAAAIRTFPRH